MKTTTITVALSQIVGAGNDVYTTAQFIRFTPTQKQAAILANNDYSIIKLDLTALGNSAPAPYVWLRRNTTVSISGNTAYQFTCGGEQFWYENYPTDIAIKNIGNAALVYVPELILSPQLTPYGVADITLLNISIPTLYESIGNKLDKVSTPNKIYGTDSSGEQTNYDLSSFSRDLNIENGSDNYSLVQKEGDTSTGEKDDRKNYAYGRSDAAFGHKNKTYQRDAFAFGGGNKVGLTENEFLELYPSGVDGSGKNYSDSYSFSIAIGENNTITSRSGSALGVKNNVSGQGSVALGGENNVTGSYSLAAGSRSSATGIYSAAIGQTATASNQASFASGVLTSASGVASVAEGNRNTASGAGSHAEGVRNTASGDGAHAEGYMSDPAIGSYGLASGVGSHVENVNNIAKGVGSHAGGCYSIAQGAYHFVHGSYLISSDTGAAQAVFGKYNADDASAVFVVGNGNGIQGDVNERSNAFEVTMSGVARAYGTPVGDNDLTPKSYVDALKPLSRAGAPTSSTIANYLGQTYIDTTNKIPYMCVDIENGTYTWVAIAAVSLDYSSTN